VGRAALAAPLAAALCAAGCYNATSTPTVDEDVRIWKSAGKADAARQVPASVTLEQAVRLSMARSVELRMAQVDVDVARAAMREAAQADNPELRINNMDIDDFVDSNPNVELLMRFPIPRPGRLAAREDAARAGVYQRQSARRALEAELRGEVVEQFTRVWEIRQRLALARKRLEVLKARQALAAKGAGAGVTTGSEASRRGLAVALQEQRIAQLTSHEEVPRRRLARLVGAPAGSVLDVTLGSGLQGKVPEREALVRQALRHRPQRETAAWAVNAARARVYVERSEAWPWFRFAQVGYSFRSPLEPAAFGLQVSFNLPIFHQNNGGIERARAELLRAELERERWAVRIGEEVDDAREAYAAAEKRLKSLQERLIPAATQHLEAVRKAVEANTEAPDALERAKLRRLDTERLLLEARLELRSAHARLEAAVGGPL